MIKGIMINVSMEYLIAYLKTFNSNYLLITPVKRGSSVFMSMSGNLKEKKFIYSLRLTYMSLISFPSAKNTTDRYITGGCSINNCRK